MDWQEECKFWHDKAVAERLGTPYQKGYTPVMLRVYPACAPDCVIWVAPTMGDRERHRLQIAVENMRVSKPAAALLQSDAWFARSDRFCEAFGIEQNLPFEAYQKAYLKILNSRFDGTQGNLPKELRGEAIFTVLKGPKVPEISRFIYYHGGAEGRFVLDESPVPEGYHGVCEILPDWWPVTVQ